MQHKGSSHSAAKSCSSLLCLLLIILGSWLVDLVVRVEVSIVILSYYSLYQLEEFMIVDALTLSLS